MSREAFVYRTTAAVPALGLEAGDDIVLDTGSPHRLTACKRIKDHCAFYNAVESGLISPMAGAVTGAALLPHLSIATSIPAIPARRHAGAPRLVLVQGGAR